jgi:NAD(P)-dependent dehydrogenase (short-subunit alcohol dehydrogenase family)
MSTVALTQSVLCLVKGVSVDSLLVRARDEDIQQIISTNVMGALYISRAACKSMIRQRASSIKTPSSTKNIITIGSIAGSHANAGQVVYSTSKAALVGMTKTLAKEVGNKGIRVNLVSPGFVETDMTRELLLQTNKRSSVMDNTPVGRIGTTDDVVRAIQFVLDSPFVTGQEIVVDGGFSL